MVFKIKSAPYTHNNQYQTSHIMALVCLALLPSIIAQCWFFGLGIIFQSCIGCVSALIAEILILKLRKMAMMRIISDNSALVTGLLLAVSIPPLSPWWIVVIGAFFAIVIAKQLYGGLGNNPFNPAMIGYVVLLISFPVQMTSWLPPRQVAMKVPSCLDTLQIIFCEKTTSGNNLASLRIRIDGITQATPLDTFKTSLHEGHGIEKITHHSIYEDVCSSKSWQWINVAWLLGGLFLMWQRIILWHIPVSFLITVTLSATFGWIFLPDLLASPKIHLLSGSTMLCAFFILTDPVTASTTNFGRLIFGTLSGLLVWVIRSFGSYPDGVAFAVLLANSAVPLIDYYTRSRLCV